jgi:hypothetical protein
MRIYISGKITGLPFDEAFKMFENAENELKFRGYEVVNPMKLNHNHNKSWESYMREDLIAMMKCDAIYLLPNYHESKGALIEKQLAETLKFVIYFG